MNDTIHIVIPYKDQDAAVSVKQLRNLSSKLQKAIQDVFTSHKLKQDLHVSMHEPMPTKGHLHMCEGHCQNVSSI